MDEIDRFTNEQNIANFSYNLYNEHGSERQYELHQRLLAEENRFGFYSHQLEVTQRHVGESSARVEIQKLIIAQMKSRGYDIGEASRVLENLTVTHELFRGFYDFIVKALERNEI